jgi:hypothetical protein
MYGALACAALMRDARLLRAAPTMPLYWPLASLAALKALFELIVRPHHWAKTEHGLARRRAHANRAQQPKDAHWARAA